MAPKGTWLRRPCCELCACHGRAQDLTQKNNENERLWARRGSRGASLKQRVGGTRGRLWGATEASLRCRGEHVGSSNTRTNSQIWREAPRERVLLRVRYEGREWLDDYAVDLGEDSMFIRSDALFEVGEELRFSISFPGLLDPTPVKGTVRWRRRPDDGVPPEEVGVGVELREWEPEERRRVLALVERLKRHRDQPKAPGGQLRVLLVEDNSFVTELFHHAVVRFQHRFSESTTPEVFVARSGVEALKMIREQPVDLVILDHYLPGITGCALLRRMRQLPDYHDTPVLMVTVGGDDIREEALESGATLFMNKPALMTQLLQSLDAMVAGGAR